MRLSHPIRLTLDFQCTLQRSLVTKFLPWNQCPGLMYLAHLPFERTFSSEYQEYLDKHDLARGFQAWATKFDIVSSTKCLTRVRSADFYRMFGYQRMSHPGNGWKIRKLTKST